MHFSFLITKPLLLQIAPMELSAKLRQSEQNL
jgi:hypothetical protein